MKEALLLGGACAVLVATGALHGLRTDRWGPGEEVAAAARRLANVPTRVGDWSGQRVELDERQMLTAQVVGHLACRYTHGPTGREITVLIVSGRPGVIGAHSPEVCYQGAGFQMAGNPTVQPVESSGTSCAFWHAFASKGGPAPGAPVAVVGLERRRCELGGVPQPAHPVLPVR